MTDTEPKTVDTSWIDAELQDSFDEELEMEIDDLRIAQDLHQKSALSRRFYFHEGAVLAKDVFVSNSPMSLIG